MAWVGFGTADDWAANHADARSVVVTGDTLLAERRLKAGARGRKHDGRKFDAASIGAALATLAIMEDLRAGMDGVGGAPAAVREGGPFAVPAGAGPGDDVTDALAPPC